MSNSDTQALLSNKPSSGARLDPMESSSAINSALESALVRKLDTKLLPYLCLMYLFAALDRSSLGMMYGGCWKG
jgi:hypothetical protein